MPYGRVYHIKLKDGLIEECEETSVVFACAKAKKLQHYPESPSTVKLLLKPSDGNMGSLHH